MVNTTAIGIANTRKLTLVFKLVESITKKFFTLHCVLSYVKYRSRTDIVAQMLDAAAGGSTKTKIMYKAYLSYAQLQEYLETMLANGLLNYDAGSKTYRPTDKGAKFRRMYDQIHELAPPSVV